MHNIDNQTNIFRSSSTTYYYSSLFFPKEILKKVTTLYAYVRVSDNFVDNLPQDKSGYQKFIEYTNQYYQNKAIPKSYKYYDVISNFVDLAKNHHFKKAWINSFHFSMASDISNKQIIYQDYKQLNKYIYGSAEVIGLFLARILNLPVSSMTGAKAQGYAMQYINFIRDIVEDCQLNRQYLPQKELDKYDLKNLREKPQSKKEIINFTNFINNQINHYQVYQQKAEKSYYDIPYRYRIPIATAASLYKWTANKIKKDPLVVYHKKVKPTKLQVLLMFIKQAIKWI